MDSQDSTGPALILKTGDSEISKITPLNNSPFLIGRGPESSLKLRNKSISRKQCCIERNETNWVIRSLGSRPLTLNGNLLFEDSIKTLRCSDIIELPGDNTFEFKCSPDQNGRCCEDSQVEITEIPFDDSVDFAIPKLDLHTSSPLSSLNSSAIDKPPSDESVCAVEVQSFNTDNFVNVEATPDPAPVQSSLPVSPDHGLLLDADQLTEAISTFRNHLEHCEHKTVVGSSDSRLSDKFRFRLEFTECMEKYEIDESCEAHERNGNIDSVFEAITSLSIIHDKIRINSESGLVMGTSFNENLRRSFLPIDTVLISRTKELANVLKSLPDCSETSVSNDVLVAAEKKIPRVCCCKLGNRKVTHKKRKEPVSDDVGDHIDDENDFRKKVKWQEAKIQFLQMKLKEKENVSSRLESMQQEIDSLVKKNAELKRSLASKDIMELEYKVLQESVKYKEEDKRSKDILQEQIDSLQSENTNLKIEKLKLAANLERAKNENAEMMDKYKKLEEKFNEKTNLLTSLGSSKDGSADNHCCEVGAARTFTLIELLESELNCSICGEIFIEPAVTNCNHTFCAHCLKEWKKMKRECPFCRAIVVQECKISYLDELIEKVLKLLSPKLWDERLRLINERIAQPIEPPPAKRTRRQPRRRQVVAAPRMARRSHVAPNPFPQLNIPFAHAVDPQFVDLS